MVSCFVSTLEDLDVLATAEELSEEVVFFLLLVVDTFLLTVMFNKALVNNAVKILSAMYVYCSRHRVQK